jgi:AcrR family transcriptional regulator
VERAALRLFAERGKAGTTMRDIASLAGVSLGASYRHHASKEALVASLFERAYADLALSLERGMASGSFERRLSRLISAAYEAFDEDPDLFSFLLLSQHDHVSSIPDDSPGVPRLVRDLVRSALESGELRRDGGLSIASDAALRSAAILGTFLQPAVSRVYGSLDEKLLPLAPRISSAACAVAVAMATPSIDR